MMPIEFEEQNCVYAKTQMEYVPLPAHRADMSNGMVITCWGLSWRERLRVLFTGKVWWSVLTFGASLQPQWAQVDNPLRTKRKSGAK